MSFCLCGPSAIAFWRHYDNRIPGTRVFGHTTGAGPTLPQAFPSNFLMPLANLSLLDSDTSAIKAHDLQRWGISPHEPTHVLVRREARRKSNSSVIFHTCPESFPDNAILVVEGNLCVLSPEYTLLQATRERDDLGLLLLAQEFCGCYSITAPNAPLLMRHPLTSAHSIERALSGASSLWGIKRLRRIIPLIMDGSGSPRESAVALLMCLPKRLGGYGLPAPTLNLSIGLKGRGSLLWEKGNAFDLVWSQARTAIEYDGRDTHKTPEQRDRDNARRNALAAEGYTLFVVTEGRLKDVRHMYAIAKSSAERIGHRLVFKDSDFRRKHLEVMNRLTLAHA